MTHKNRRSSALIPQCTLRQSLSMPTLKKFEISFRGVASSPRKLTAAGRASKCTRMTMENSKASYSLFTSDRSRSTWQFRCWMTPTLGWVSQGHRDPCGFKLQTSLSKANKRHRRRPTCGIRRRSSRGPKN